MLDVRTRAFFEQLPTMFADLSAAGTLPEILFLEAGDDVIVRRQESVRRPHPLQGDGRLLDGIVRERETLATLRAAADLVIDTSSLNVHQLASRVTHAYGGIADDQLRVTVLSFGFKNGVPVDADMVFDVRFLPNPHWVPELRPQTGLSKPVSDYVLRQAGRRGVPGHACRSCCPWCRSGYINEGKRFATIAHRLHRRQAPQHGHGRGVRPAAARRRRSRPRCCTAIWAGNERPRAAAPSWQAVLPGLDRPAVGGRLRRRPRALRPR